MKEFENYSDYKDKTLRWVATDNSQIVYIVNSEHSDIENAFISVEEAPYWLRKYQYCYETEYSANAHWVIGCECPL